MALSDAERARLYRARKRQGVKLDAEQVGQLISEGLLGLHQEPPTPVVRDFSDPAYRRRLGEAIRASKRRARLTSEERSRS